MKATDESEMAARLIGKIRKLSDSQSIPQGREQIEERIKSDPFRFDRTLRKAEGICKKDSDAKQFAVRKGVLTLSP
jgi:hypothetical protein